MDEVDLNMNSAPDASDTVSLNEIKVVFLGDGEAGKSHIIARLLNDGGDPVDYTDPSVPGISIKTKDFSVDGRNIQIHVWDFGGQEILHGMHRIFMTGRTFYVVVLNARDGNMDERARFWLRNIHEFADDAPVILVLNKIDQNSTARINEPALRNHYPNLRKVVALSAREDDRGMFNREFTAVLLEEIQQTGYLDVKWPISWFRVKRELEGMGANYIRGTEYRKTCRKCGVEGDESELLRWFHDLGIGFACDDYRLEDLVVFRPDWIINALYMILFNECPGKKNGFVPYKSIHTLLAGKGENAWTLRRLLPGVYYARDEIAYVLGIFRKFQLSFSCGSDCEFIPMLCDVNASPAGREYEQDAHTLECQMRFEHLPHDLLYKLMIDRKDELQRDHVWRTGALFKQTETGLSAVVAMDANTLKILVRHTNDMHRPNTYLSVLKANVDRIWPQMGLQSPDTDVVYKEGGVSERFDYDLLTASLHAGETRTYSRVRKRLIKIEDILNQAVSVDIGEHAKLLRSIVDSCRIMQADSRYYHADEDSRNTGLRDNLLHNGYFVQDQSRWGTSPSGRSAGEVDLMIRTAEGSPWSIIEALNIREHSASIKHWDQHLSQLLNRYNPTGLPVLYLLSYVECSQENYIGLWKRYSDHMRRYSPERCEVVSGSYQTLGYFTMANHFTQVSKCDYHCGGRTVTVYHLFVRMGDSASVQETKQDPQQDPQQVKPDVPSQTILPAEEKRDSRDEKTELQKEEKQQLQQQQKQETDTQQPAQTDKEVLYEYRVVLLGDSEAGKSLILARLKDPEMDPASFSGDTTPGIDLHSRCENIGGKYVRVNYWDFGGQEILHSMHRMFLAAQTLYVIVLNTRNDNQDAQANFWLRYVQTYAPGAPVLFVMNKMDQNPRATLNLPVLRRQFNREFERSDILQISAIVKDPEKFREAFTLKLFERIAVSLDAASKLRPEQVRIRDAVQERKKNSQVISCDDFRDICEEEGVEAQTIQDELMNRFHETGIMVFFGEGKPMLLNPEWITAAIYKVLEKRDELSQNGIVSHKKIRQVFRKELGDAYASNDAESVLQVMRAYGMSFLYEEKVPGVAESENKEFIPMLCQREEPQIIEELVMADNTLELQMIFEYLPGGVLHQLMVDRQKELNKELAWLTGAKFECGDDDYAIVRREGNILSIYVHHANRIRAVKLLLEIANQIQEIAKRTKYRAKIHEVKIGFRIADIMEYFDYDRLVCAKSCDLQYVASKTGSGRVAVCDILDQQDRSERRDLDELLRLTLSGCMILQDNPTYWWTRDLPDELKGLMPKMNENARNRALKPILEQSFIVEDQHEGGESAGGIEPGKMDLRIRLGNGDPWSILEALIIYEESGSSKKRWIEHLERMATRYNKSGFRNLILVSYLEAPAVQFGLNKEAYHRYLNETDLPEFGGKPKQCEYEHIPNCPGRISVSRAHYTGGAGDVTIFHFLVHIPEYRGKQDKEKESASAE